VKLAGPDIHVALDIVMKAKKALIDSGLLARDFSTAEEILERRKALIGCTTGSSKLDSFLKGGKRPRQKPITRAEESGDVILVSYDKLTPVTKKS
jgi:Rad51